MLKFFKRLMLLIIILVLLGIGAVYYAFKIEPYRVVVKDYNLNESSENAMELKIAQISDLHIKMDFTKSDLAKVVDEINGQSPDIVVFTGDLYDNYDEYNDNEGIISQLSRIKAKYGKIAIWGNRDVGGGAETRYDSIIKRSGFTLLCNDNIKFSLDNGKTILFTGIDDSLLGQPSMPETLSADYKVFLTHEPDVVDNYADYNFDIALTGHSHGGQFHIPLLDSVNKRLAGQTELCDKYLSGMYELDGNINEVFVNTGIGTTHVSARFGVTPEVSLFHVYL